MSFLDSTNIRIPLHDKSGRIVATAVVDAASLPLIQNRSWYLRHNGYAASTIRCNGRTATILMHRRILGLCDNPGPITSQQLQSDHINGDRLDNRRENLRMVTAAENHQNLALMLIRGVSWDKARNKWRARTKMNGHSHCHGRFDSKEEAIEQARRWRLQFMPFAA